MGVFPAASGNFLPDTWRNLMSSPVSVEARMTFASASVSVSLNTSAAGLIHHWLLPWGFCYWSQWKEVRVAGWVHGSVQISVQMDSIWPPEVVVCVRICVCVCVCSVWLALISRVSFWRCCPFAVCGWASAESGASRRLSRPHTWRRWENTWARSSTEIFSIIVLKEQAFIHAWMHKLVRVFNWRKSDKIRITWQEGSWVHVWFQVCRYRKEPPGALREGAPWRKVSSSICTWRSSINNWKLSWNSPQNCSPMSPQMYHFSGDIFVDFYFKYRFQFWPVIPTFP